MSTVTPTSFGSTNTSAMSSSEERDREIFMQDVNRFMGEIGKPLSKIPIMGYKELDLYQLFKEVVARGGFNEVVRRVGTWSKIWKRLSNFDPSITDSSFRLRKNYERYLLDYEYSCYPEHRSKSSTGSGSSSQARKKRVRKTPAKDLATVSSSSYRFPLVLSNGDLVISSLGEIIPHAPFTTEKHIWPVGYTAIRKFASVKYPSVQTFYHCKITQDTNGKPQFIVECSDFSSPIVASSPSAAWKTILQKVNAASSVHTSTQSTQSTQHPPGSPRHDAMDVDSNMESEASDVSFRSPQSTSLLRNGRIKGALQFGLTHPAVHSLLQDMISSPSSSSLSRSASVTSNLDELGTIKRKASEMCLADLAGSDQEEATPTKFNRKRVKESTPQELDLFENAVSLLTEWQMLKA